MREMGAALTFDPAEEKRSNVKLFWVIGLSFALILGRGVSSSFFYPCLLAGILACMLLDTDTCVMLVYFLLPFSTILKSGPDSRCIVTVLFFMTALRLTLRQVEFSKMFALSEAVLLGFLILFSGFGQLTTILTICAGMFMVYCLRHSSINTGQVITAYAMGICLASGMGVMQDKLPIVRSFVTKAAIKLGEDNYALRFSGLEGNPNYFTLDVIIIMAAIAVLIYLKKASKFLMLLMIPVSVFGLMSVSKSFLASVAILLLCWFIANAKDGVRTSMKLFLALIVVAVIAYLFAGKYVNMYITRFAEDESGSLQSITTGRTAIWKTYFKEINESLRILLVGKGLNTRASIDRGAHNTFIESLFCLGITGTCIMFWAIKTAMGRVLTRRIIWLPVLVLVVRMLAIGILTYDNLWFYLAVIGMLSKETEATQYEESPKTRGFDPL